MRPLWFKENEDLRRKQLKRRRGVIGLSLLLGISGFIISIFMLTRHFQIGDLKRQIAVLKPEVERIESIRDRWKIVSTGVDQDASFLEVWMNIFNLQSISKIKIESLSINRTEIAIIGNASGASEALGFIEELVNSDQFQEYAWDYQPPTMSSGGFASFEIKGIK